LPTPTIKTETQKRKRTEHLKPGSLFAKGLGKKKGKKKNPEGEEKNERGQHYWGEGVLCFGREGKRWPACGGKPNPNVAVATKGPKPQKL